MRFSVFSGIFLGLILTKASGSQFSMTPWILIFEPQSKVISQMVTYAYQGANNNPKSKEQGPMANDANNAPVPVEINISAREINLDGTVAYPNSNGADNFVVYPSQFILYPGDSKKIQVQWVGSALPTKEIAYGFISTQIPLDINKSMPKPATATGSVSIVSRYEGIIVVRIPGTKPAVVVDTAYSAVDTAGTSLVFILNNKGSGLQSLKTMSISVFPMDKAGKYKFGDRVQIQNFKTMVSTNQSLFPGFRRKVSVPWPAGLPIGPVSVAPEFSDAKK